MTQKKTYPLANLQKPTPEQLADLQLARHGFSLMRTLSGARYKWKDIRAVKTGEFRPPVAGEWYLSVAIPEAYRAIGDMHQRMWICRLVLTNYCEKIIRPGLKSGR